MASNIVLENIKDLAYQLLLNVKPVLPTSFESTLFFCT